MKLPVQAQPVIRQLNTYASQHQGILPSGKCCGDDEYCLGPCICLPFGGCSCAGACIPKL
jgi:hypothetical protein